MLVRPLTLTTWPWIFGRLAIWSGLVTVAFDIEVLPTTGISIPAVSPHTSEIVKVDQY